MENIKKEEMFRVLKNEVGQYSFWPEWKEIPQGWKDTGVCGSKEVCSDYIDRNWRDLCV